jgi:hypothetical protein
VLAGFSTLAALASSSFVLLLCHWRSLLQVWIEKEMQKRAKEFTENKKLTSVMP